MYPQSIVAEWQSLLREAALQSGYFFEENVEQYLSLTLAHFTTQSELATKVVAFDFLSALENMGRKGGIQLRHVGDECLLLSGLFPEVAKRKNVKIDYFIGMGQEAYHILSYPTYRFVYDSALFNKLSADFKLLASVLQNMRHLEQKPTH